MGWDPPNFFHIFSIGKVEEVLNFDMIPLLLPPPNNFHVTIVKEISPKELERAKYLLADKATFLFEVLFWNI